MTKATTTCNTSLRMDGNSAPKTMHSATKIKAGSLDDLRHKNILSAGSVPIATIIPLYKQSQYLVDAVISAMDDGNGSSLVVIVNDGCPERESDQTSRLLRSTFSDRIAYLHQANGGLSSARNTGIRYVLNHRPDIEAIFFLDADNLVGRGFFQSIYKQLTILPDIDWIYFPLRIFGSKHIDWLFPSEFNTYRQLYENQCDAGSVVRRRAFENGFLFDESMKNGYEDWEFFLRLAISGRRAARNDEAAFYYRAKRESMLTTAQSKHEMLYQQIRTRHKRCLEPRNLTAIEHANAPRFLLVDVESGQWAVFTDPTDLMWRTGAPNIEETIPPIAMFSTKGCLTALAEAGALRGSLLVVQEAVRNNFVQLRIDAGFGRFSLDTSATTGEMHLWAGFSKALFSSSLSDDTLSGIIQRSTRLRIASPKGGGPHFAAPFITAHNLARTVLQCQPTLNAFFSRLQEHRNGVTVESAPSLTEFLWTKHVHSYDTTYLLAPDDRIHIAFFVPWLRLGGVDICVRSIARAMKSMSPKLCLHLILTAENIAELPNDDAGLFDEIIPIGHLNKEARLHLCDAIASSVHLAINAHSQAAYEALDLRAVRPPELRTGRLISYLHVIDLTTLGKPCGYCQKAGSLDAFLDGHAVISEHLRQFLINEGVKSSRIKIARNAPAFRPDTLDEALALANRKASAARDQKHPMRVLFAGRLDLQKGLPRLRLLIELSQARGLNVEFTIVGSPVCGPDSITWPDEGVRVFPGVHDGKLLKDYYSMADVFVLLSRWEGVPLSILDAMSHGTIVVATDVGAVGEVLSHSKNGFLLADNDDASVAKNAVEILQTILRDPDGGGEMRRAAVNTAFRYEWREAARTFLDFLEND